MTIIVMSIAASVRLSPLLSHTPAQIFAPAVSSYLYVFLNGGYIGKKYYYVYIYLVRQKNTVFCGYISINHMPMQTSGERARELHEESQRAWVTGDHASALQSMQKACVLLPQADSSAFLRFTASTG